ncbi:MAG: ABC transporter permease, partial [Deltaproteobacteria bacterium]
MKLFLSIAARNLLQARRRTLLLSAALGLVTLLLVILLALSQGITDNLIRSATTLSAGHVNVAGFYKPTPDDTGPILTGVAEIRRIVVEHTPGLAGVIDRHRGWAKVISERGSIQAGLSGIDIAQEDRLFEVIELAPESEYEPGGADRVTGDLRRLAEPESALIFVNQARRLGVGVGDRLTLRTETLRGTTNTADVTVVAVARNVGFMSNWSVFVPKETILDLYQLREDTSGAVMVYLDDIDRAPEVMAHLREVFEAKGYRVMDHAPSPFFMKFETVLGEDWTGQKLDLTLWKDEVSFLTWVVTAVDSVSFFLIGILVVIIAI